MAEPLLFISHKHSDSKIAQVLGAFIEERSNGRVKVHLSSSPEFKGPRFGRGLNDQLRQALWNTEVLILVYTSADQDWSYCMWECGVATHPQSPNTNIIVFQCGSDVPAPFQDVLRVNARSYDDIKRFTDQFLRDPTFFPSLEAALAPTSTFKDLYVENAAKELHRDIVQVLPMPDDGLVEEWPTWPYLRVELPRSDVEKIEQASESERMQLAYQIVKDYGVVVESDARAAQLFGQAGFPSKMKVEALLRTWKGKYPDAEATWFDSCCEQIMIGAGRGFPVIRWTPMKEVGGDSDFTPVLSRIRRIPFGGSVQFDLYFYNLADPRAVPVTLRMIPLGDFFFKNLGEIDPQSLKLKDLVEELELRACNRIPMFNNEGCPIYIVHRSMIDKFIAKRAFSVAGSKSPNDLTLADLLADHEMQQMFTNTFVVVKRQATLAEAKSAMLTRPGCRDVFVTAGGDRNEAVQGWLTNVDIARSS
jgi:hypothetical protein